MKKNQKNLKYALMSVYSVVILMIIFLSSSCGSYQENLNLPDESESDTIVHIIEKWYESERTLVSQAKITGNSLLTFAQTAKITGKDLSKKFYPEAIVEIELSKARIDFKKGEMKSATLTSEKTISEKTISEKNLTGKEVIQKFEFSDGQSATVTSHFKYQQFKSNNEVYKTPHIQLNSIDFEESKTEEDGKASELEIPYKRILTFAVSYETAETTTDPIKDTIMVDATYKVVETDEETQILSKKIKGNFYGNPVEYYLAEETIETNKGTLNNTYKVGVKKEFKGPKTREISVKSAEYPEVSIGQKDTTVVSIMTNKDGFIIKNVTGTYTSTAMSLDNSSEVESVINFNYAVPTKLVTPYQEIDIPELEASFQEESFTVSKITNVKYKSTNIVNATFGTDTPENINEIVYLSLIEPEPVIAVDSVMALGGNGNNYLATKTITWSNGQKTTKEYALTAELTARAEKFGDVLTQNLNWSTGELTGKTVSVQEESTTQKEVTFKVRRVTEKWVVPATNGIESGEFIFITSHPEVTIVDGSQKYAFPVRKHSLSVNTPKPDADAQEVLINGVKHAKHQFNCVAVSGETRLTSYGALVIKVDDTLTHEFTHDLHWKGNKSSEVTGMLKINEVIRHSNGMADEYNAYALDVTLMQGVLSDNKRYAENFDFSTKSKLVSTNYEDIEAKQYWTVRRRTREFHYTTGNGNTSMDRTHKVLVIDAVVTFQKDGYKKVFDLSLNTTYKDRMMEETLHKEEGFEVQDHILEIISTVDTQTLYTRGITTIYVEK